MSTEQRARVKVIDKRREMTQKVKGKNYIVYYFTFEFSSDSRKVVSEWRRGFTTKILEGSRKALSKWTGNASMGNLDCVVVNDIGILTYKEWGKKTKLISFERDNYVEETELSLYDKLYNTGGGKLLITTLVLITTALISLGLIFLLLDNKVYNALLFFLIYFGVLVLFTIPKMIVSHKLKHMPQKKELVTVLESGAEFSNERAIKHLVVFKFPNGSRKSFAIELDDESASVPVINDTGMLTYQKFGNDTRFVKFEKN